MESVKERLRDERMSYEMHRLMEASPSKSYFFAVGIAHLTHHRPTIRKRLEDAGYIIERIQPGEKLGNS